MNDEHREIERLFSEALACPADQRFDLVARAAQDRPAVYDAVCELLRNAEAERAAPIEPHPNGSAGVTVRIRGYEILQQIGQGGMGIVYRARQLSTGQVVAVKLIRSYGGPPSESLAKRFEQEWRALGRLDHPGIARVLDAGRAESDSGVPYLVMEYVDGPSLRDYVDRNQIPLRDRLALMASIAEAVNHAHQRLVIHRDLKPANIRVTANGVPKILDFGLARILEPDSAAVTTLTGERVLLGTLAYMSPEQAAGYVAGVDVRSDVYALGVILYELMTGALPHNLSGLSLPAAIRRICEKPARTPESLNPHLNRDVLSILNTAIAQKRDDRYGSAAELSADLRRYLVGEPISVRQQSVIYQLVRFAKRHKILAAAIIALALTMPGVSMLAARYRSMSLELERQNSELEIKNQEVTDLLWKWDKLADLVDFDFKRAASFASQNDWARAAEEYGRGRNFVIELLGASDHRAIAATYNYALVLMQVGRLDEAEPLLRETLKARENLDRLHLEVVRPFADLGRLLLMRGRLDEAEQVLSDCQARFEAMPPPQAARVALVQLYRGKVATNQQRFRDAEALLSAAAATFEGIPEQRGNYRAALRALVELYQTWVSEDASKELADKLEASRTRFESVGGPASQPS